MKITDPKFREVDELQKLIFKRKWFDKEITKDEVELIELNIPNHQERMKNGCLTARERRLLKECIAINEDCKK